MRLGKIAPAALLVAILMAMTFGVSFGVEETPDFYLRDYKSGFNKTMKEILTTNANILVLTETTCYSCIKELKAMEWLRSKYKDRISVTAVFEDREGWPRVKKYLDLYQFDLDYFLVDSAHTVPDRFKTNYIPTLLIFDKSGNEIYRKQGFVDGEESMLSATLEDIIYGKKEAPAEKASAPPVKTSGCASASS